MKKKILVSIFLVLWLNIFGQNLTYMDMLPIYIDVYLDSYLSLLGKSVPDDFIRIDRVTYTKDSEIGTIAIILQEGIINQISIGSAFYQSQEAAMYLGKFYDYFEDNWDYIEEAGMDAYSKNGVDAIIYPPRKRDDGLIVARVTFIKI